MKFNPIVRIEALLPNVLDKDSDNYEAEKIKTNGHFYLVDKKEIYLQALLTIKQLELNEIVEWVLWVKMPAKSFVKMSENLSGEKHLINATLVSPILFYENTAGLEVSIKFELKEKIKLPIIKILDNHKNLFFDYKRGMEKEKYLLWQDRFKA